MDKNAVWKWLILVLLVCASGAILSRGVPLGLDLQGGCSFIVQIDEESLKADLREQNAGWSDEQLAAELPAAVTKARDTAIDVIRGRIDSLGIREPDIYGEHNNRIVIQLPGIDSKTREDATRQIQEVGELKFRLVHKDNDKLVAALFEKGNIPDGYKTATVGEGMGAYYLARIGDKVPALGGEALRRFHAPGNCDFMLERRVINGQEVFRPHFVNRMAELKGNMIERAYPGSGDFGTPLVLLQLDSQGKHKFKQISQDYCPGGKKNADPERGRQLAIVLDEVLYSAPEIKTVIYDGNAQIEGIDSVEEARHLSNILEAGALPARVNIISTQAVDPSLGTDSIRSGVKAAIIAAVVVALFMAFYYLLPGMLADIGLALNIFLMPLGMVLCAGFMGIFTHMGGAGSGSVFNLPVLTLPGIAGIALTIGMAVDANVLIFERIREEQAAGKTVKAAVAAGFDRAFLAIFDSNMTTILSAMVLFLIGSGSIRGFAITLSAGLIVNMYTAITVSRMLFELILSRNKITSFKMLQLIKSPNLDFIKAGRFAIMFSIALFIVCVVNIVVKYNKDPNLVLGVEFLGGSAVTFRVDDEVTKPSVSELRAVLGEAGIESANLQYRKPLDVTGKGSLVVRTGLLPVNGEKQGAIAKREILAKYSAAGIAEGLEEDIGPQVGKEMARGAGWALFWASIIMLVYIALRFEFAYATGAIVAVVHDVIVSVGVYVLMGHEVNLAVVAGALTIIGYSVNDTIVIFDRFRENLKNSELRRKMSYREICNYSINQMLSRTILTSLTVLISVVILLVFGGGSINDFALIMTIGAVCGVYSTMFVATPVMLMFHPEKRAVKAA